MNTPREVLLALFTAALARVNGARVVADYLIQHPLTQPCDLIAMGKAACAMATGALRHDDMIRRGLVITKHGHLDHALCKDTRLVCLESDHPVPGPASLAAGQRLLAWFAESAADSFLFLISGGTSSLVEVLPKGMTLQDLQALNAALLASGGDIGQINRVRRAVSCIKGGRLARYLKGRKALVLLISDVPNDDPRVIGSGLLVPPHDTPDLSGLPAPLPDRLKQSLALTSPAPEDFAAISTAIVARLADAKQAAASAAQQRGYPVTVYETPLAGEAASVGIGIADVLRCARPGIHIWGGETSVSLPPNPGRGGRNQHLALTAASVMAGRDDLYLLAAGTDGTDGPTEDAGALVDGGTIARGQARGFDAQACLARANAGSFLNASGDLIRTGPTGTNVMDLVLGLVRDSLNPL